jgi:hypothetical protein
MSFKVELWDFFTKTTSSLHLLLQGHPWLCFLQGLWPNPSKPDPMTQHTAHLTPAA